MSGWRHVDDCGTPDDDPFCGCTTPTPDPTSPCGWPGCSWNSTSMVVMDFAPAPHDHQPTRCTCGHAIEAVPVVAVSKVLGHSTLAITVDFYGKEADAARQRAASYMDRVTGKVREGA